ncbi:DUF4252 domain-containing protein [Galbibacter orientalis]|uniref:DUF4252 domain-containing protein n=1 Tax=Galbibacter orientalis DSM 19592 TaxID=926559 RepID=I3C8R8_9FLAO|nr:DUF4252 domain-containing protein [Galbibacter orientalis]EIJ40011.1 hypothetical protein JoomaDRAFT_3058 [Galbibacter orientalis DSM 19592]
MKILKNIVALVTLVLVVASCGNGTPSLQEYYVNNADNPNFISLDIPASILGVASNSLNEKQQEAFNSVKKLNVLAFRVNEDNKTDYESEKTTVQSILKDTKYEELMVINSGKHKGVVKYLGDDDTVDEVILFGSDDEMGFALIRVLGNKMKPENMMSLVEAVQKGAVDSGALESQLKGIFNPS